jgi:hypothetical protein
VSNSVKWWISRLVIRSWSKENFQSHHPGRYWETFIWKNTTCRDVYSLTSRPEFGVIINGQKKPLRTHSLKLSQPRPSRVQLEVSTCRSLQWLKKHFIEFETSGTQFTGVDNHSHRWSWCVNILCRSHSWNVSPNTYSSSLLNYHLITRDCPPF